MWALDFYLYILIYFVAGKNGMDLLRSVGVGEGSQGPHCFECVAGSEVVSCGFVGSGGAK